MTHPIIKTENYLLVGSNDDLRRGWFYCVRKNDIFQDEGEDVHCCMGDIRIAAHLPLNNASTLEGVPLLPPLENEEYDFAEIFYNICKATIEHFDDWVEAKDYNKSKTKEDFKYTEEDLAKLFYVGVQLGINQELAVSSNKSLQDEDAVLKKCIQSLQQPKYPVAFDCEMVDKGEEDWIGDDITGEPFWNQKLEPKTITNSQGLTQLVGKYIY
jgi:hypothetical protein